jgi:hypothetical protein
MTITKILNKLEMISRIANHQQKRLVDKNKKEKMEILKDSIIVMERYLGDIKRYTAIPDKDKKLKSNYFIQNDDIRNYLYNKVEMEMKTK